MLIAFSLKFHLRVMPYVPPANYLTPFHFSRPRKNYQTTICHTLHSPFWKQLLHSKTINSSKSIFWALLQQFGPLIFFKEKYLLLCNFSFLLVLTLPPAEFANGLKGRGMKNSIFYFYAIYNPNEGVAMMMYWTIYHQNQLSLQWCITAINHQEGHIDKELLKRDLCLSEKWSRIKFKPNCGTIRTSFLI